MLLEPMSNGPAPEASVKVLRRKVHQTLKSVTRDFEKLEFNTIVSGLMELLNDMYKAREAGVGGSPEWTEAQDLYLRMMAPVAPHISEELWQRLGKPYSVHTQSWPEVDEEATREDMLTLPIQVNGKLRDRVVVPVDASDEEIRVAALSAENVQRHLEGRPPKKVIVVPGKLVNIVG